MPSGTKRHHSQVSDDDHMDHSGEASQSGTHGTPETTNSANNAVSADTEETASDQESTGEPPAKKPRKQRRRKNEPEEDYSQIAREKTHNSGRTRQACDRCQARKLRCDKEPTGCAKCAQANLHCFSTDRTTGITFERGQLERIQVENQQLRVENGQLRQRLWVTMQQAETMQGMLQQLGHQPFTADQPSQATDAQQLSQLLMQPMPSSQSVGGVLQGQSQDYINSSRAPTTPYPLNSQTGSTNVNTQRQNLAPRRPSTHQRHVSERYQTRQRTLQQAQEQQYRRHSLPNPQQVGSQMFQERSQAQSWNMSYPPNDGGVFTYPTQPQLSISAYFNSGPSLSQASGTANSMPGSLLPESITHSTAPSGFLHDYTSQSGLVGLGGEDQGWGQNRVNTRGQNGTTHENGGGIYPSSATRGLASDSTLLTNTWTMDGRPFGIQQAHDGSDSQQEEIHGTTSSSRQRIYGDQQRPQEANNQTYQAYRGQQRYNTTQRQPSSNHQQRYPDPIARGQQTRDPRLLPRHGQQQTYDSQQQRRGNERTRIQQQQQQHGTSLPESSQVQNQAHVPGQFDPAASIASLGGIHDPNNNDTDDRDTDGSDVVITGANTITSNGIDTTTPTATDTGISDTATTTNNNNDPDTGINAGDADYDGNENNTSDDIHFPDPGELEPSLLAFLGIEQ